MSRYRRIRWQTRVFPIVWFLTCLGGVVSASSLGAAAEPSKNQVTGPPADEYLVFPLPTTGPDGSPQVPVVAPADSEASPFGWHDTDGDPDPDFTDTRGNNVSAQEDQDANNSGGFVDANDFVAVQGNFGADNGLGGEGDANCSGGFVDANDFVAVQGNFGADCG